MSEIVPSKGVKVVGPLPAPIANATAYAAGIMAASRNHEAAERFMAALTAPAQRATWIAMGFEPAGRD
jgi:molybdate transport system substrate-binding protein